MLIGRAARQMLRVAAFGSRRRPLPLPQPAPLMTAAATAPLRRLCSGAGSPRPVCWKCSRPLRKPKDLFCECGIVQSPHRGLNHYELLLPGNGGDGESAQPTYRVDQGRLASAMRRLQWQLHPDKFVNATDEERSLAQQQSAKVNAAYRCLSDPVQRAVYLLELRGVAMPTEESSGGGGGGHGDFSMPQEFLAEMLELNEALMEADKSAVGRLSERVDSDTNALIEDLARAFDAGDLTLAKELTYRLRYFANVRAKIREMP